MISYVKGRLADIFGDTIVVEAGSLGFNIRVPLSLLDTLPDIGREVLIYTYFQVKEDAMTLYGFSSRQDLDMFKMLIGVYRVGPKGALAILSVLTPDSLRIALVTGDAKAIAKAPGVGSKTAQRIILDLKDKVPAEALASGFLAPREEKKAMEGAAGEAVDALAALGYSQAEAYRAVSQVEIADGMTAEDVLKASLKHLAFL